MTTWSTTDLSGTVALSGGNLIATGSGAQFQGVRSSTGKSSGKPYFELTVSSDPGSNGFGDAYWGLATAAQDFTSDSLWAAPSFAAITNIYFGSRFYCGDGSGSAAEESIAGASGADGVSSILSFAPDLTNGLIWYSTTEMRAEGLSWNWDSGAVPGSSGGLSLRGLQGNPMFAFFQAFFGYGVTANFGASSWAQAPPSGWTAWDPQGTPWSGAATISGAASVRATGLLRLSGSARIAATATVLAVPSGNVHGIARISGAASVHADGYLLRLSAQALISGSATLRSTASLNEGAAGSIAISATIGAAATALHAVAALMTVSVNINVDSTVTLAGGAVIWNSGAAIAGTAAVRAAASHVTAAVTSSISGNALIVADAVVSHAGHLIWQTSATIPVVGSLHATPRVRLAAAARISVIATVSLAPHPTETPYRPITTAIGAPFYCVEISARQPGSGVVSMTLGWATTAWGTLNLKPSPIESSGVLLASDVGYRTAPSDPQRVVSYPPVLVSAFSLTRGMAIDPGGTASGWGWGSIALANDNGRFDGVASTWNNDGRPAIVLRGAKTWDDARGLWNDPAYGSLQNVFAGVSTPWRLDAATLTVPLRDATYWTERTIQILTYGGTGTYDGTAALKGSSLPKTRGGTAGAPILNVTPVLIDPVNLIWQYSDAAGTVVNLYEGAAKVFTADGDTSNLYSGSVASGHFRTDNSRALFQLGSSPALGRAITCDVTGQFPVGGVKTTPADIALWLLRDDMSVPIENIDVASFTAAASAYPYTAGIYFAPSDNPDGATAVSRVLAGIGAKLIPSRSGQLGCFVLRALTGAETPAAALNATNIVSLTPTPLPPAVDPPPYRLRLAWGHNYTVQTSNINVATATAAQQQFVAQADTFSTWISNAVLGQYRRPNDPAPFGGTLCVEADADAVVSDLGALWGQPHTLCDVELPLQNGLAIDLGDVVQITYPIGGLRVGRFGTVVGERFNSGDPTVTLTVLVSPATAVATVQVGPGRSMLAPIVTVVARASVRAAAVAIIGLSASVSVDSTVILAAGQSASALIGVVGNVAASAAARHAASARISGVASVNASPSLTGALTAWSTTDHTPAITLSNVNRTATATSEGAMVRSSGRAYTTGKVYVEFSSPVYTPDLSLGLSYQNGSLASIQIVTASGGGAITDTNGHVWTIVPTGNGQIAVDGVTDGITGFVILVALVNGQIWQKNTALNWYFKTLPTDTWGGPTTISPLPFVGKTVDSVGFFPGRASQDLVLGNNNIDNWTGTSSPKVLDVRMQSPRQTVTDVSGTAWGISTFSQIMYGTSGAVLDGTATIDTTTGSASRVVVTDTTIYQEVYSNPGTYPATRVWFSKPIVASPSNGGWVSDSNPLPNNQAMRSNDIINRFCINVFPTWGEVGDPDYMNALNYLGIRRIRAQCSTYVGQMAANMLGMLSIPGMKVDFIANYPENNTDASVIASYVNATISDLINNGYSAATISHIESTNEPNNMNVTSLRGLETALSAVISGTPALKNVVPHVSFSTIFQGNLSATAAYSASVGSLNSEGVDFGNSHNYTNNGADRAVQPWTGISAVQNDSCSAAVITQVVAPGRPFTSTEFGPATGDGSGYGFAAPIAQMKMGLNQYFDNEYLFGALSAGAQVFGEPVAQLALFTGLSCNTANPPPTATPYAIGIHNATTLLNDSGGTALTFNPGALAITVTNLPSSGTFLGRYIVYAKSNDHIGMIIWNEPPVQNTTPSDITPTATNVTLTVNSGASYSAVAVYDPCQMTNGTVAISSSWTTGSGAAGSTVGVTLLGGPLIVEFTP